MQQRSVDQTGAHVSLMFMLQNVPHDEIYFRTISNCVTKTCVIQSQLMFFDSKYSPGVIVLQILILSAQLSRGNFIFDVLHNLGIHLLCWRRTSSSRVLERGSLLWFPVSKRLQSGFTDEMYRVATSFSCDTRVGRKPAGQRRHFGERHGGRFALFSYGNDRGFR